MPNQIHKYAVLICLLFLSGCTIMRQQATLKITHPDGTIEDRTLTSKATSFWDTKQIIDRLRASNGKTLSLGTTGLEHETSATNAVDLVQSVVGAAVGAAVRAAK